MKTLGVAALLALTLIIEGCGGGGGGGGGGGIALPSSSSPPATTAATATTSAPALAVSLNGAKLSPDSSGAYVAKPGDQVSIEVDASVLWTMASDVPGAVSASGVQAGSKTWKATLLHDRTSEDKFTLAAQYGSGAGDVLQIAFKVGAANNANGSYRMFSAVGGEYLFKVNFDLHQFALLDKSGTALRSGTLKDDATTAGTYLMVDALSAASTSNNARFRITADTLVGAAPMPLPYPNANGTLMDFPFVATRNVVTDKAALDGLYNRLDLTLTPDPSNGLPSLSGSRVRQIQIAGQGATLDQCNEGSTISPLSACTGAGKTLVHYTGSAAPDADGHWTFTNAADINDKLVFAVARIDGENILLQAGVDSLTPTHGVFRIGTPSVPGFADLVAYGGSPLGDWSKFTIAASSITIGSTALSGTATTTTYPLLAPSVGEPQGFRKIDLGGGMVSFVTRSSALYVSMGYIDLNSGLVQIGLTH